MPVARCNRRGFPAGKRIRPPAPIEYGGFPEWPKGTDCKSAGNAFGGSNPPSPTKNRVAPCGGARFFAVGIGFEQDGDPQVAKNMPGACFLVRGSRIHHPPPRQKAQSNRTEPFVLVGHLRCQLLNFTERGYQSPLRLSPQKLGKFCDGMNVDSKGGSWQRASGTLQPPWLSRRKANPSTSSNRIWGISRVAKGDRL